MHCPFCSTTETRVIDSRLVSDGNHVRRRRECARCEERFTTYEVAELVMPYIIKQKDGKRQSFDEGKLRLGMEKALQNRPVSQEHIEGAIARIKAKLRATGEREVNSQVLGEAVMQELRELDEVAYVRFASVYRKFKDLDQFRAEIDRLAEDSKVPRQPD